MGGEAEAVDGSESFLVCCGFSLGSLVAVCLEDDVRMFIEACVIEVDSAEAVDIMNDLVREVEFESV